MDAMEPVQAACEIEEDRARLAPEAERLQQRADPGVVVGREPERLMLEHQDGEPAKGPGRPGPSAGERHEVEREGRVVAERAQEALDERSNRRIAGQLTGQLVGRAAGDGRDHAFGLGCRPFGFPPRSLPLPGAHMGSP